ncbi:hypothetical protein BC567DRAFT_298129 [Phyllosticta citribraziliensis]
MLTRARMPKDYHRNIATTIPSKPNLPSHMWHAAKSVSYSSPNPSSLFLSAHRTSLDHRNHRCHLVDLNTIMASSQSDLNLDRILELMKTCTSHEEFTRLQTLAIMHVEAKFHRFPQAANGAGAAGASTSQQPVKQERSASPQVNEENAFRFKHESPSPSPEPSSFNGVTESRRDEPMNLPAPTRRPAPDSSNVDGRVLRRSARLQDKTVKSKD